MTRLLGAVEARMCVGEKNVSRDYGVRIEMA